ncbi:hypothetical protein NL676_033296 [Syzygium grande]|nr:hypothetical protein NL676_033296 [Syzygium grande]
MPFGVIAHDRGSSRLLSLVVGPGHHRRIGFIRSPSEGGHLSLSEDCRKALSRSAIRIRRPPLSLSLSHFLSHRRAGSPILPVSSDLAPPAPPRTSKQEGERC